MGKNIDRNKIINGKFREEIIKYLERIVKALEKSLEPK